MKFDALGSKYFVCCGKIAHTLQPGISGCSASRHIAPGQVRPGDFITYGYGGDKHMVFVIARLLGGDFLCMSHGGPTGETPQYQKHSVLVGLGVPTFCRVNTAARHPLEAP